MFTGIIEEIGKVKALRKGAKSVTLEIQARKVLDGTLVGDSIATNGVCLTVTSLTPTGYTADVMPETVRRTSLAELKAGSSVNLERALTLQSRLGGHIVSGHVDGTGRVARLESDDNALWIWVACSASLMRYIIVKGSVTLQGVSLTVAKVKEDMFAVSLIPHTQGATTLHDLKVGDVVNIENDMIAKYVERLMNVNVNGNGNGNENENQNKDENKDENEKVALYRSFMM